VTMGKPMGAGHPLAVVVTTPAIADAFAQETDYFNTFGGNPVSAAVGMAVLDVVEKEDLLASVHRTGRHFIAGLQSLATRHARIGDIRGKGLFIAVELVEDRQTRQPASAAAAAVVESLREQGVLTALIGRDRNTLKFRPPLVFQVEHADIALAALDSALSAFD
jgi:4-aminobutyrate aminotransferase-like enzyme